MTISVDKLSNPSVRALVAAINSNDEQAFYQVLSPDATMSDDGSDRDLRQWADAEIFSSHGHLDVASERSGGVDLIADYRNDTWGEMRTAWHFEVEPNGLISRFETGQA